VQKLAGQLLVSMSLVSSFVRSGQGEAAKATKPRGVTVADTIRMTTIPEPQYAVEDRSKHRVALFSPDQKHFAMVAEHGIVETNEREFSLFVFATAEAFDWPPLKPLVTLRSRSNRDAIRALRWVDNERLVFLGEVNGASQVFRLELPNGAAQQLTHHPSSLVDFDYDAKSGTIAYAAERAPLTRDEAYQRCGRGYAIWNEALDDIPRSLQDCKQPSLLLGPEVYVQRPGQEASRIVFSDYFEPLKRISLSPGGKYVVFDVLVRKVPREWRECENPLIRAEAVAYRNRGPFSWLSQFLVADTATGRSRPLVNGTMDLTAGGAVWAPDGNSVVVSGVFLPLDVSNPEERQARRAHSFVIEVNPAGGVFTKISSQELIATSWNPESNELLLRHREQNGEGGEVVYRKEGTVWMEEGARKAPAAKRSLEVTLEQGLNAPPRIFVGDPEHPKQLLWDLNPQFRELEFGKVEHVSWLAKDGHTVEGGLYYPPHFKPGRRYPVVLQTHGFSKDEFWINGPWNSAFAAQPLAARDILVLQIGSGTEPGSDARAWRTPAEAPRQMAVYEGAIDYLDARNLIDPNRVGIIGFSRTVYSVEYTLTHSSYRFAAATAADGFDGGYLQYLVNPYAKRDWMTVNGGEPFGATLGLWLERSPSFAIERVKTPVRLEGYGDISSVIGNWEWYAKLVMLDRPVDLIYIPDGTHLLVKPWERMTSQQGNVDWFCFWLKGEEDSDPAKREQYERWRGMRMQLDQLRQKSAN